jgi:hypothetical protein
LSTCGVIDDKPRLPEVQLEVKGEHAIPLVGIEWSEEWMQRSFCSAQGRQSFDRFDVLPD